MSRAAGEVVRLVVLFSKVFLTQFERSFYSISQNRGSQYAQKLYSLVVDFAEHIGYNLVCHRGTEPRTD